MKKKLMTAALTAAMAMTMGITAFAGEWEQDETGWWWNEDNGSYPVSEWRWLDGNEDGIYECYYFGADGYMLADTTTPDGYTVNIDGAWTVDGGVQLQYGDSTSSDDLLEYDDEYYYESWDRTGIYMSEKGDYLEIGIGAGDSLAAMYYDEDGDFQAIYSFSRINDTEYKDTVRSRTIKFLEDGSISMNNRIYYY